MIEIQNREKRANSRPASPHRWHWRDGFRRQFWRSFEGWCRDFGGGSSARTSACCGSESISPRGCTHQSEHFHIRLAVTWICSHCFQNSFTLKKKEQLTLSFSVPKMLAKYSAILLADLAASEISISYGWQHLKAAWRLTNGVWFHCCLTNGTPGKLTNISHRHWTIDVDGNLGHWNSVAVSGAFFHFLVPAIPRV